MTRLLLLSALLFSASIPFAQQTPGSALSDIALSDIAFSDVTLGVDADLQASEPLHGQRRGDHASGPALHKDLAERPPSDPAQWLKLANEQFARGEFEAAAASARRGIEADGTYAPLYLLLGYAEWASGNLLEADLAFRTHIRHAPDKPAAQAAYREFRDWNVDLLGC